MQIIITNNSNNNNSTSSNKNNGTNSKNSEKFEQVVHDKPLNWNMHSHGILEIFHRWHFLALDGVNISPFTLMVRIPVFED